MKLSLTLPLFLNGVAAFTRIPFHTSGNVKSSELAMGYVFVEMEPRVEEVEDIIGPEDGVVFPTVNGWTADPKQFCAGLPGNCAPLNKFDPLEFTDGMPVQEIKRLREAEVTHGRVSMLATLGYLVAEKFHPFFNGAVTGPANTHLSQVQHVAPFFFAWLAGSIATAEIGRAIIGWEAPVQALKKNKDVQAKTWLSKLNDNYYPGDIGFDPLGLKPRDPAEFAIMQTKELNNGRLAMFGAIGMIVQEQVTHQTLF